MSLHKLNSILIMTVIALAAISCKKDDDDTQINYVDGTLRFELPEFILPHEVLTMKPTGLTHPTGGEIGYCWKVNPSKPGFDTTRFLNGLNAAGVPSDGSYTHKFSDTLKTYTVYCYGFAEGYSASIKNLSTTVVDPGLERSITGTGIKSSDPSTKVNGNEFYYATIGNLDWFRQNLAYTESGTAFRNGEPMSGVFGRYYSYEEAVNACPEGWRLPTLEDWADLGKSLTDNQEDTADQYINATIPDIAGKLMANAHFNEVKMWEYWPSVGKLTNESGLSIIPTGYANLGTADEAGNHPAAIFEGVYEYAVFWTADKNENGMAYYRYIYCDRPDLQIGFADPEKFGAAVRCVRDSKAENE